MTASPDCTPFSWMMPSTVRSAFVFSWIKVSVPLVTQLIWPGAVNAAVPMKVKSWLPATVSFASMLVKWSTSSAVLKSVIMSGSKLNKPNLVDGLPQESVAGAAARHGVLAIAAVDDVDTVIADDTIVVEAAGEGDGRRPGGLQNLDLGIEPDIEAHAGQHGVETLAFVFRRAVYVTVFEQGVAGIVDDVGVVTAPAVHGVGAGAAVDDVVSFVAVYDVVELVAGQVDGGRAVVVLDVELLDLGAGRQGVAGVSPHYVERAFADVFPDHVAGIVDVVVIVVGAAIHDVGAAAADEIVLAGLAAQHVALAVADQDVLTGGAVDVLDADELRVRRFQTRPVGERIPERDRDEALVAEVDGVGAGPADQDIRGARALERIVACAAIEGAGDPDAAYEDVVAVAAVEEVIAAAALDDVVAVWP